MADAPNSKPPSTAPAPERDDVSELIWILLAVFLFFSFVSLLVSAVNSNKLLSLGWRAFTPQGLLISTTKPISTLINPINTKFVVIQKEATLYDSPAGKEIAIKKLGDNGTILGGPVSIKGEKYWRVRFEDGDSGWMKEDDIANLPQSSTPMRQMATLISTRVEIVRDTEVFSEPGTNRILTVNAGTLASILQGPIIVDGVKYWQVRFDNGTEGWVAEDNLNSIRIEKQPISESGVTIGGRVSIFQGPADIFQEPGSNIVGVELIGATGTVLDGPREINSVRYWRVRFDSGQVGWVEENNLENLKITRTPLSQMPTFIGGKVSINRNGAPLLERPDGKQIGSKNRNSGGEIVEGPLVVNGSKYWHIKFDDGSQGWVVEDDLNYIENVEPDFLTKTISSIISSVGLLRYLAVLVSIIFAGAVFYLYRKLSELRTVERLALYPEGFLDGAVDHKIVNPNWERVLDYIESFNESDWKLAIMEADIMLSDLLDKLSVSGETMGDKLKTIEKSDFTTIDFAWDAHKVRNQIAHESDFRLSQREARRVIDLYRSIFDEFEMI